MKCLVVIALGLLAGCGQLRVAVDVLDPQHVRGALADETLRQAYLRIVVAEPGALEAQVMDGFRVFQGEVGKLAQSMDAAAGKLPEAQKDALKAHAADLAQASQSGELAQGARRHGTEMERRAQEIRELGAAHRWHGRGALPRPLHDKLAEFLAEDKRLAVLQRRDVNELLQDLRRLEGSAQGGGAPGAEAPESKAATRQAVVTLASAQRSITQDTAIADTAFAYVVASAPEPLWSRDFNEAYASGVFGNFDIVIRLNSTADFSVKGMQFDATKVAQVASKVATQSLLLGAQLAGVPVATATSGTSTGGDALSRTSSDLMSTQAALARREAFANAQRDAARAAARAILASAPALEADALKDKNASDPARVAVHQTVNTTLQALRPLLSMQGVN